MRKLILTFLFFTMWMPLLWAQPMINELMSSNSFTVEDDDGDYSDWIELYNPGTQDADLTGYFLSDAFDNPQRWAFPAITIPAHGFLLIWASGKNRTNPSLPLHTNFSLSSSGEELLLCNSDGVVLDEVFFPLIQSDVSYGRSPDGTANWRFFGEPTPGASNVTESFLEILSEPVFSASGGFYGSAFELVLSHPDPDVQIIYTLDGSIPDSGNLGGSNYPYKNNYAQSPSQPFGELQYNTFLSIVYQEQIPILDRSLEPDKLSQISSTWHFAPNYLPQTPVPKAVPVRARAFKSGALPSKTVTHTYFIGQNTYTLPVICINLQEDALFDYYNGTYVAGVDYDNWRIDNPGLNASGPSPGNYYREGDEYEIEANFEYFPAGSSTIVLNQGIGVRNHGAVSRSYKIKTLRLYARNRYGVPELSQQFFPNLTQSIFKRLILRNSGQDYDSTFFRDAVIQSIVAHLNFDTQAYQPTILFINGEYWGVHNIRERFDKHYIGLKYGLDPENVDLLENNASVVEGSATHYSSMRYFLTMNDISIQDNYEIVKTRMDVDSFIDYNIAEIYCRNTDWPFNNIKYWRLRTDQYTPQSPMGHDGRWRWMMYDTDWGFGLKYGLVAHEHNTLQHAIRPEGGWSTFVARRLFTNDEFKISFINRFADLLNTTFLPSRTTAIIQDFKERIEPYMPSMIHRWRLWSQLSSWHNNVNVMTTFVTNRPDFQWQHLMEVFDLEGFINVELNTDVLGAGSIKINSIALASGTVGVSEPIYPWTGRYFAGIPITLEALPAPGYSFSHWSGILDSLQTRVAIIPEVDLNVTAHFIPVQPIDPELVHFWIFNASLANDTPLVDIYSSFSATSAAKITFQSCLEDYPYYNGHPLWRKASMERRNAPTNLNYWPDGNGGTSYENSAMRGMQVKQPMTHMGLQNSLQIHVPTSGFEKAILRFAVKDEGAAEYVVLEYSSVHGQREWTSVGLSQSVFTLSSNYQVFSVDFSSLPSTDDNPDFWIRIRFGGSNLQADAGNRVSFNNFSLEAISLGYVLVPPEQIGIQIVNGVIHLSWEPVNSANSYHVYSSSQPHGQDWEMIGLVDSPNWQSPIVDRQNKMFYRVQAARN